MLRRFENYYGRTLGIQPPLQQLSFDIIQHENTRLQSLRSGELDIGFMRPAGFDLNGFESKLLHRENYHLVMQFSNKLAALPEITADTLSGQNLILFAREVNPAAFDQLTAALSPQNLPPPVFRQDARNKNSVLAMVEAGFGAALLPESCLKDRNSGIEFRPVSAVLPAVEIMAVWKSEKRPPLLDHISFDPEKYSLELI